MVDFFYVSPTGQAQQIEFQVAQPWPDRVNETLVSLVERCQRLEETVCWLQAQIEQDAAVRQLLTILEGEENGLD